MIRKLLSWYSQSLANRIALVAFGFSISTVMILGAVIFFIGVKTIESNAKSALLRELEIGSNRLELRMNSALRELERISKTSSLADALADINGRRVYLPSLLENQSLIREYGGELALLDFRGRLLGSNQSARIGQADEKIFRDLAAPALNQARPSIGLRELEAGYVMELAYPVVLPVSGRPEGVLFYRLSLGELIGETLVNSPGRTWRLDSAGRRVASLGGQADDAGGLQVAGPINLLTPLDQADFRLLIFESSDQLQLPFLELIVGLAASFLVISVLVLIASRFVGRYISGPLIALTGMATRIASQGMQGRLSIQTENPDEVGDLARAFSKMLAQISRSQITLQEEVRSQTQELRIAQVELEVRNQRLSQILALSPDGFVEITPAQRIGFVNQAFEKITGLASKSIVGTSAQQFIEQFAALQDTAQLTAGKALNELLNTVSTSDELQIVRLSQPAAKVLALGVYPSGVSGRLIYVREITREAEIDQMKSDFLSLAAHELRTPLASISGFSELLIGKEYSTEKRGEMLRVIHRHAKAMTALVNDLLEIVRSEARVGRDYLLQVQPLTPMLSRAIGDFRMPDDPRDLVLRLDEHLPQVLIDSERIRQVVLNLLSNALKYSDKGSPVEVSTVDRKIEGVRWVGFRVKDYGIGMSQEELSHLYERFYRANPHGPIPGTGLGMALIKQIIDQHRGRIEVDSAKGSGTAVTILLPAVTLPA